jgi:hypothetical protein
LFELVAPPPPPREITDVIPDPTIEELDPVLPMTLELVIAAPPAPTVIE